MIRWNVSAGAARPNPQGSFRYGQITVTDVYIIVNKPPELINGKWRTTLNGISYLPPSTPLKLAQQFKIPGVYKLDFPNKLMNRPPKVDTSLINGTYKGFMEIILQNNDTTVQNYHLDGYAFFVVGWAFDFLFNSFVSFLWTKIGKVRNMSWPVFHFYCSMDFGVWTENSRSTYNKWDGVARCTTQVLLSYNYNQIWSWNYPHKNLLVYALCMELRTRSYNSMCISQSCVTNWPVISWPAKGLSRGLDSNFDFSRQQWHLEPSGTESKLLVSRSGSLYQRCKSWGWLIRDCIARKCHILRLTFIATKVRFHLQTLQVLLVCSVHFVCKEEFESTESFLLTNNYETGKTLLFSFCSGNSYKYQMVNFRFLWFYCFSILQRSGAKSPFFGCIINILRKQNDFDYVNHGLCHFRRVIKLVKYRDSVNYRNCWNQGHEGFHLFM